MASRGANIERRLEILESSLDASIKGFETVSGWLSALQARTDELGQGQNGIRTVVEQISKLVERNSAYSMALAIASAALAAEISKDTQDPRSKLNELMAHAEGAIDRLVTRSDQSTDFGALVTEVMSLIVSTAEESLEKMRR